MRFSKARMYKKRAMYKKIKHGKKPKAEIIKPVRFIEKEVGSGNNKGKRKVRVKKHPQKIHPEGTTKPRQRTKRAYPKRTTKLRSTIVPGTVCILLAGRHKGKRVVFLKQLRSGLMLVNGPFTVNRCPLRRIAQSFVIATSTRIDLGSYEVPKHLDDEYFRRIKLNKAKKDDDIFDRKKERYTVSEKRKEDQKAVDSAIVSALRKHPDSKIMWKYLKATFELRHGMLPHKMKF
jgi:large subunit ribosomal protein L6e